MKIIWIYVALTYVALAICDESQSTFDTSTLNPLVEQIADYNEEDDASLNFANHKTDDDDDDSESPPVLPPIILLDFADDEENNSTSDEKSKRTVNNELGYGYLKNNFLNGKFNYYFPGDKSGTAVSIEESVSPFQPKTIVEPYKSNTERTTVPPSTQSESTEQADQPVAQPWTATFPSNQPIFGQRTKLRKAPSNFAYQYSSTSQPDYSNHKMSYTTPKPFSRYNIYSSTPGYKTKHTVLGLSPPDTGFMSDSPTTPKSSLSEDSSLYNLPRYTIENGVKYENKIVWKYPDGRIAHNPPSSYINSYTEYSNGQNNQVASKNPSFHPSLTHQNLPFASSGLNKFRNSNAAYYSSPSAHQGTRYPAESISNVHSQRPAQFPIDQESNFPSRPNANSQAHSYDFSYQDNYGYRQRGNVAKMPVRSDQSPTRGNLKLTADTDNPEYTYTPPSRQFSITTPSSNLVTEDGQVTPQLVSKYSPQVQKYLSKVLSNPKNDLQPQHQLHQQHQMQQSSNSEAFIKNNYENILNYNPSISQYIKDPSSILNAHPTFIQAGSSLVPVIILRVDGARPIESQSASNINLKSLLQQYITKYADNHVSTQNYGNDDQKVAAPTDNNGLLNDLNQFTQALRRYSSNTDRVPMKRPSRLRVNDQPRNYDDSRYIPKTSYDVLDGRTDLSDSTRSKLERKRNKSQKVKSVEILNGPHIQNYHELRQS